MALILNIETGTDVCSVGISCDGNVVSLRESTEGRDHARNLAVYIEELLKDADINPAELDAVAVGRGPGSYTGLRIGTSVAKGLCYALNTPLIAVNSLQSMCNVALEDFSESICDFSGEDDLILCPMIDARRMEVYCQLFNISGESITEIEAKIIDRESFEDIRKEKPLVIFGSGAAKCIESLHDAKYIDLQPSSRGMVKLAEEYFIQGNYVDTAYFEPFYLKDFIVTTSPKKIF